MRTLLLFLFLIFATHVHATMHIDALIRQLRDDETHGNAFAARDELALVLYTRWYELRPALLEAMRSNDRQQRQLAMVLWAKYHDDSNSVRMRSVEPDDTWLFDVLIDAFHEDNIPQNATYSQRVLRMLLHDEQHRFHKATRQAVEAALTHENYYVRKRATRLLVEDYLMPVREGFDWPPQVIRNWLQDMQHDPDGLNQVIRVRGRERLIRATRYDWERVRYPQIHRVMRANDHQLADTIIAVLTDELHSTHKEHRSYSAILLAEYYYDIGLPVNEWSELLLDRLVESLENDRVYANKNQAYRVILHCVNHPRMHQRLIALLQEPDRQEHMNAAWLLIQQGQVDAHPEVFRLLVNDLRDDTLFNNAMQAFRVLQEIDPAYARQRITGYEDLDWQQNAFARIYFAMNSVGWYPVQETYTTWLEKLGSPDRYFNYDRNISNAALFLSPPALQGVDPLPRWLYWNLHYTREPRAVEQRVEHLLHVRPQVLREQPIMSVRSLKRFPHMYW